MKESAQSVTNERSLCAEAVYGLLPRENQTTCVASGSLCHRLSDVESVRGQVEEGGGGGAFSVAADSGT